MWNSHTSVELMPESNEDYYCNGCKTLRLENNHVAPSSWYRNFFTDKDVCGDCYGELYSKFLLNNDSNNRYGRICDVCIQNIRNDELLYTIPNTTFDACEQCYNSKRPFGININQSGFMTDRDGYILAKHIDPSLYTVPQELTSQITEERNKEFIDMLDCIVRPPDNYTNILEWTLLTDMEDCVNHHASCGLAINCVDQNHPVASIVSDDHGRVAMNILYNSYTEYLNAIRDWKPMSFPEAIRSDRNMMFYYG